MNILLTWPEQQHEFCLTETSTADKPLCFDVVRGSFFTNESEESESISFYWHHSCPVIRNHCRDYICIVDGYELAQGEYRQLWGNSKIQAGNFRFITLFAGKEETDDISFYDSLDNFARGNLSASIEEILPRSGYHLLATENLQCSETGEQGEEDILRQLEREYKTWLVMGERYSPEAEKPAQPPHIMFYEDEHFARMQDAMKHKTLTECIFESPALIGRVFAELNMSMVADDFQPVEERYDLLSVLAPENYVKARKKNISPLAYQTLYHPGLDSQF